ncbi:MAG: DUF3243 domain-containing protein [Firmicutes bacterium]|nr:DUF3243 domain-containing protein [Bacillota bacterium]
MSDLLASFKKTLKQRIEDGLKHGVSPEVQKQGMVNLADMMVNFVNPDTPEEALVKELWEVADEDEKKTLTDLVYKLGQSD